MEQKQRLFIYDRKEMGILILLGVMVAIFAFTLGVHLGKRVGPKPLASTTNESAQVATATEQLPHPDEISDQAKNAVSSVDSGLNEALQEEVGKTGIKLDTPRQVELPTETHKEAHSTSALPADTATKPSVSELNFRGKSHQAPPAEELPVSEAKFTLQVGSHPGVIDAKKQIDELAEQGLKPFMREVQIRGKGKWFRVYLGGYENKADALRAGGRFKSQHVIGSFIVAKIGE